MNYSNELFYKALGLCDDDISNLFYSLPLIESKDYPETNNRPAWIFGDPLKMQIARDLKKLNLLLNLLATKEEIIKDNDRVGDK